MGEDAGLARPGPGHHEQGAVGVDDGLALDRVQALQQLTDTFVRHRRPPYRWPVTLAAAAVPAPR